LGTANLGDMRTEFEAAVTIVFVTTDKTFEEWDILEPLVGHIVKN
jgi:hypothetical protein